MTLDYQAIGKRIKIARVRKSITQECLAELVDISTGHMSNIETGSGKVSLKMLITIANTLEVPIESLLADNIVYSSVVIRKEIQEILDDCDEYEIKVIAHVMSAVKEAMRRDRALRGKDDNN